MRATACMLALVLLAGCSDPPSADGSGDDETTATPAAGVGTGGNRTAPAPVAMSLPVELDGNLGSFAHYCVFAAGPPQCDTRVLSPGVTDLVVEHPGSNFTGLD